MEKYNDQQIIMSWKKNVDSWITAIGEGEIEDRLLVTNQAIMDAIFSQSPNSVLDIGCGEGWLCRELGNRGIRAFGIDVIPGFIEHAQQAGGGRFSVISYEEISSNTFNEKFDVVVCNFSLFGHECVDRIFKHVPILLNSPGSFIIQTIHPVYECGESAYEDGWRDGSWVGFNNQFRDPAPWYFRTRESWEALFRQNGFTLDEILEPLHPVTNTPKSIIFIGQFDGKENSH